MKFRRKRLDDVGVNLTPLIDVVFLLLIFFMVSTTFTRETQLSIDLPEAQGQVKESSDEEIEILIDESGGYRVNGQGLVDANMRTLQAAIYKISAGDTTMPMIITADALSGGSKLRKLIEGEDRAVALPFYPAEGAALEGEVTAALRTLGAPPLDGDAARALGDHR